MTLRRHVRTFGLVVGIAPAGCHGDGNKASLPPPKPVAADGVGGANPETVPESSPAVSTAKSSDGPAGEQPPAPQARVAEALGEKGSVEQRLSGQIEAPRRSQVAFRVAGFIETIRAQPGQVAKKGDVLAELDGRDFVLRVELARARRDQAKVAADAARRDFEREVELKNDNASTASVLEKMQAAYDQSRLALRLAELDLQQADLAVKDTKLLAPYDCVVAKRLKDVAENVAVGNGVLEVYDTSEPEVALEAPERLLGTISVGSRLVVNVPSLGFSGDAAVTRFVPVINEKTRTFAVTARLAKAAAGVVPGSYVEALLK